MKKVYLIDVSNMFFRAFYAIRSLTSPSGLPTNAIYGFVSMIVKLLKDEKPDYLVFCYDLPGPSFRSELYSEYKAHRDETPPDLIQQIPYIKKIVDAFGYPAFEREGFEADDLIGTIAELAASKGCEVVIVSGDKDFSQLIRHGVFLLDTMKDMKYSPEEVKAKWGVRPDQFIDYLSLVGDSSDNIPGVDGIGSKGAQKLISDFGSLDEIYKNIESIKGATKDKLLKGKESAYLSQHLVTIKKDIPLGIDLTDLQRKPIDYENLHLLVKELNFKSLELQLFGRQKGEGLLSDTSLGSKAVDAITSSKDQHSTEQSTQALHPSVNQETPFKIVETTPEKLTTLLANTESNDLVWAWGRDHKYYLSIKNEVYPLYGSKDDWQKTLSDQKFLWAGFNLKELWRDLGVKNPIPGWDSQLAAYLIKTEAIGDFNETVLEFLGLQPSPIMTPQEELELQVRLYDKLKKDLKLHQVEGVYQTIELPLTSILLDMEQNGVLLDLELLKSQNEQLTEEISWLEKQIHKEVGSEFNIASPKQLSHILFEKLMLPTQKKTKTGFSTDNDVLEKLKMLHPCIPFILEYRELTKLKSTYVEALPLLADSKTHRVHTHFNQALTATGRLSSTQPNLQNIPIRTERGAVLRRAFIAPMGSQLVSLDYSQIELRILAHITEDQALIEAFKGGKDIHAATAAEIYSVKESDVTSDMRRSAKAVNFGIAYGQGAFGLAENLGISRKEAQDIINRYFQKFPGVKNYMESVVKDASEKGFVSTFLGRRRILKEIKSSQQMLRKFAERAAINAPIQGAASDIVKLAMIQVHKVKTAKLILQVHDELVFECPSSEAETLKDELAQIMETVVKLKVPLKVSGSIGVNWEEAH